jgi:hypothetical protein
MKKNWTDLLSTRAQNIIYNTLRDELRWDAKDRCWNYGRPITKSEVREAILSRKLNPLATTATRKGTRNYGPKTDAELRRVLELPDVLPKRRQYHSGDGCPICGKPLP